MHSNHFVCGACCAVYEEGVHLASHSSRTPVMAGAAALAFAFVFLFAADSFFVIGREVVVTWEEMGGAGVQGEEYRAKAYFWRLGKNKIV